MCKKEHDKPFVTQRELIMSRMRKFCSYRDRCHQEVRSKLIELKVYGDDLEEILAELIIDGFLNEERYARSYTRGKWRINRWGKNKIRQGLNVKGIPGPLIESAMLEIPDEAYMDELRTMLQKKAKLMTQKEKPAFKQKLSRFAQSKGYEYDLINQVLSDLLAD